MIPPFPVAAASGNRPYFCHTRQSTGYPPTTERFRAYIQLGAGPGWWPRGQRFSDLPVVAERILDPAEQPIVSFGDRNDLRCACPHGPVDRRARMVDDQ